VRDASCIAASLVRFVEIRKASQAATCGRERPAHASPGARLRIPDKRLIGRAIVPEPVPEQVALSVEGWRTLTE
jgi:hypothetical protein